MSITLIAPLTLDDITTPHGEVKSTPGGPGLHFAISASIMANVNIVSVVGEDYPREAFELFHEKGCDVEGLLIRGEKTPSIEVEYQNRLMPLDFLECLYPLWEPHIPQYYLNSEILYITNMNPEIQFKAIMQSHSQFKVFESSAYWVEKKPEVFFDLLSQCNMAILDYRTVLALSEEDHPLRIGEGLIQDYALSHLGINKLEEGVTLISQSGDRFSLPLYNSVPFVDPHGFMDSLFGGFFSYIDKKGKRDFDALKKALTYGTVLASFNLESFSYFGLKPLTLKAIKDRARHYIKANQVLDY